MDGRTWPAQRSISTALSLHLLVKFGDPLLAQFATEVRPSLPWSESSNGFKYYWPKQKPAVDFSKGLAYLPSEAYPNILGPAVSYLWGHCSILDLHTRLAAQSSKRKTSENLYNGSNFVMLRR